MDKTQDDGPLTDDQLGEVSGGGNLSPTPPRPGQTPAPPGAPSTGNVATPGDSGTNPNAPPPTPGGIG
jgi:hypothetical protein